MEMAVLSRTSGLLGSLTFVRMFLRTLYKNLDVFTRVVNAVSTIPSALSCKDTMVALTCHCHVYDILCTLLGILLLQ
jgi:hypothetical protein